MIESNKKKQNGLGQGTELMKSRDFEYDVFISHAEEDRDIAEKLYDDLKEKNFCPWMRIKDMTAGSNEKFEIRYAVKKSKFFIFFISQHSVTSRGQVQSELKIAIEIFSEFPGNHIFIIPARIDQEKIYDDCLEHLAHADFSKSYDLGFAEILRTLKRDRNYEQSEPKMPANNHDSSEVSGDRSSVTNNDGFNEIHKKEDNYIYIIHVFHDNTVTLTRVENGDEKRRLKGKINESHIKKINELNEKAFRGIIDHEEIKILGNCLFEILFCGIFDDGLSGQQDFKDFYTKAKNNAKNGLNIELRIETNNELYDLPWEFIKQLDGPPLSTDPNVKFYRRVTHSDELSRHPIEQDLPVRVLRILSSKDVKESQSFEYCKSKIDKIRSNYKIKFDDYYPEENISQEGFVSDLNDLMYKHDFDIIHFIGHGKLCSNNEKADTHLSYHDHKFDIIRWMDSESFTELLSQCKPKIVFFQSCETGAKPSLTMTRKLIQQNIPVIIVMQYEIEMCKADEFSLIFYESLAEHGCVLQAVQKGRNKLREHLPLKKSIALLPRLSFSRVQIKGCFGSNQRMKSVRHQQ